LPVTELIYIVTGMDKDGKQFKLGPTSLFHAINISSWNGSPWRQIPDGKRKLIKRVYR
jgi:hypothetical protein